MSVISGPGIGRAPAQAAEGIGEQGPVVVQVATGQPGQHDLLVRFRDGGMRWSLSIGGCGSF